jgi:hypothetical protein
VWFERKRGVFYLRSRAFLHFHEDSSGLHADVRLDADFQRLRVQTRQERSVLFDRIRTSEALLAIGARPLAAGWAMDGRPGLGQHLRSLADGVSLSGRAGGETP